MEQAWIAVEPAALDAAIAEAARLLGASRCPVFAGLGTDVAGARAAIMLAQRAGAVIDHMHSDAVLRNLDVMRSSGVMITTPGETHVRADTLVLTGAGLLEASPQLPQRLFGKLPHAQRDPGAERRIFWLCPGRDLASAAGSTVKTIGKNPGDLAGLIAALRARVAGRPAQKASVSPKTLDEVA